MTILLASCRTESGKEAIPPNTEATRQQNESAATTAAATGGTGRTERIEIRDATGKTEEMSADEYRIREYSALVSKRGCSAGAGTYVQLSVTYRTARKYDEARKTMDAFQECLKKSGAKEFQRMPYYAEMMEIETSAAASAAASGDSKAAKSAYAKAAEWRTKSWEAHSDIPGHVHGEDERSAYGKELEKLRGLAR